MEIPCQLLFSYFYVYFLYWYTHQIGMDNWYDNFLGLMRYRYLNFLSVLVLSGFVAQGIGFYIGTYCVNSVARAFMLSTSVLLFLFLFSGFFVKRIDMDIVTDYITYYSFVRFSFESLLIIIYGDDRCESPANSAILYIFNLHDNELIVNVFYLVAYHLIIFRALAYFKLRKLADREFLKTTSRYPYLFDNILPRFKEIVKILCKFIIFFVKITVFLILYQVCVALVMFSMNKDLQRK